MRPCQAACGRCDRWYRVTLGGPQLSAGRAAGIGSTFALHNTGAYYASVAIKARLAAAGQIGSAREVTAYQEMVSEFREAIKKTLQAAPALA